MREIREWLEAGRPYAQGVALYETHGSSRVVLKALQYGETDFTRATLLRELTRLAGGDGQAGQAGHQSDSARTRVHVVDTSAQRVRETAKSVRVGPESVPADHPQRRTWLATRSYTHAQLELVGSDAERRELAATILDLADQVTASYQADVTPIAVPQPDLAGLTDLGEVRRLLANLRPRRSKLKKRPDRAGELARVEAQITLLEEKLKNRDGDQPQLHPGD